MATILEKVDNLRKVKKKFIEENIDALALSYALESMDFGEIKASIKHFGCGVNNIERSVLAYFGIKINKKILDKAI